MANTVVKVKEFVSGSRKMLPKILGGCLTRMLEMRDVVD